MNCATKEIGRVLVARYNMVVGTCFCLVERSDTGKSATWELLTCLLLMLEDYERKVEWTLQALHLTCWTISLVFMISINVGGRMFKYTSKVCKNQIVTASHPHTVLDMRPSTTNNPTSNQDPKFMKNYGPLC